MKILSFGEILWDIYPDKKYIGGAPLNFAAHLAKHGEEVYMLSALGKDSLGSDALKQLEKWNISAKYISFPERKPTGSCLVSLDENKVPSYNLLQDVAYDYIDCSAAKECFDVLYFGTLSLRSEYNYNSLKAMLESREFEDIFVDVNIRPPYYSEETVSFSVQNATILKISLEELPLVAELLQIENYGDYKAFAKILKNNNCGLKCIIITLGSDGAYALDCQNNREYSCGCAKVEVKSTVGAGDSFSAAFLHKYLKGNDIGLCLDYASRVAGFVVSQYDAVPDYGRELAM